MVLEPRLRIFEIALVKWVYNLTVIATCAFTCYLFLTALPSYIEGISMPARWAIVVAVIAASVYSSSNVSFMKWLAVKAYAHLRNWRRLGGCIAPSRDFVQPRLRP